MKQLRKVKEGKRKGSCSCQVNKKVAISNENGKLKRGSQFGEEFEFKKKDKRKRNLASHEILFYFSCILYHG